MITRVLIADSNTHFRSVLRRLLERDGDIQVCGEAASLPEAETAARRLRPDVALLDIALPGLDDPWSATGLHGPSGQAAVVFLSLVDPTPGTDERVEGADYLLKSVPAEEILTAIRRYAPDPAAAVPGRSR